MSAILGRLYSPLICLAIIVAGVAFTLSPLIDLANHWHMLPFTAIPGTTLAMFGLTKYLQYLASKRFGVELSDSARTAQVILAVNLLSIGGLMAFLGTIALFSSPDLFNSIFTGACLAVMAFAIYRVLKGK